MSSARPATQAISGTVDMAALRRRFVRLGKPAAPPRQARVRPRLAITVLGMLDDNESMREDTLLTQLLDEQELSRPLAIHTAPERELPAPDTETEPVVATDAAALAEVATAVAQPETVKLSAPTVVATENIAAAIAPTTSVLATHDGSDATSAPASVTPLPASPAVPSWPSITDAPTRAHEPIVAPGWPTPAPQRAAARTVTPAANEPIYTVGLRPAIGTSFPMTITPYRATYEGS